MGVVVVAVAAVTVLFARQRFLEAIDEIEIGATSLGQGDLGTARVGFAAAGSDFESAQSHLDAWWVYPARAMPVLSQNVDVLREVAPTGVALSARALESATVVDYEQLRRPEGGVELAVLGELPRPVGPGVG